MAATIPSLNILSDSYRHSERTQAFQASVERKTAETQAAYQRELYLLLRHKDFVSAVTVLVFLIADILGIYLFWNYGRSKPMA
ncbi:MAG: hypothetical protein ACLQSR_14490 [Limisphaerales bacterium]